MDKGYVILDARGLLLHSYHTSKDVDSLLGQDGKQYNRAEHGFGVFLERYMLPILESVAPRNIIACFEGGKDYRVALYENYKSHKGTMDPVLKAETDKLMQLGQEFFKAAGILYGNVPGVEADDLVALLCERLQGPKSVYTVDADLLQLSNDSTMVFLRGEPVFDDYKGCPLNLIRLQKSILGDSSDGYVGVKGVGPKAWDYAVETFGFDGLEELDRIAQRRAEAELQAIAEDTGDKFLQKLLDNWHDWMLMYELAKLHPEICEGVAGRGRNAKIVQINWVKRVASEERLLNLLEQTDTVEFLPSFRRFLPTQKLITAENLKDLSEWLRHVPKGPIVSFDYESFDTLRHQPFQEAKSGSSGDYVDVLSQRITGASFTAGDNLQHTIYVSVHHADTENVPPDVLRDLLVQIQKQRPLVVQNAAFEATLTLTNFGEQLLGDETYDTQIMASYVNENEVSGLKQCSLKYLGYKQQSYQETVGDKGSMDKLTGPEVLSYGCDDAVVTASLWDLYRLIMQIEGTLGFYERHERCTVFPLVEGFEAGVKIDYKKLRQLEKEDQKVIDEGFARMRELLSEHCTEESPERARILYEEEAPFKRAELAESLAKRLPKAIEKYLDKAPDEDPQAVAEQLRAEFEEKDELKLKEYKDRLVKATAYRPLITFKKEVKFAPTKAGISKLAHGLGIRTELAGVTPSHVSAFILDAHDELNKTQEPVDALAPEFLDLLGAAAPGIRKREGDDYKKFEDFCVELLSRSAPEVKEGDELNVDSPNQMQELLYCKLGLPIRLHSKVNPGTARDRLGFPGAPSTNEKAIDTALAEDLEDGDWRVEFLKTLKAVNKALTRFKYYYRTYPLWEHPRDGMIHPQIKNCGTVTRRPSGNNPNILQVSKGPVRTAYLPRKEDHVIVSLDFNGQELRITGSESEDPVLLDAYVGPVKKDIHSVTGALIAPILIEREAPELFEVLPKDGIGVEYDVFNRLRKMEVEDGDDSAIARAAKMAWKIRNKFAKAVNFLIVYGGQASTLARNLIIKKLLAEAIMDMVFRAYPRLKPWQAEVVAFALEHGYTQTAFGSRRHLNKDLFSQDGGLRSRMERQAINFTIQGCAADILKIVLSESHKTHLWSETGAKLIAPVYDEITASVPASAVLEYVGRMMELMEITPPGHKIPMVAELSIGNSWGDQIEIGADPTEEAVLEAVDKLTSAKVAA